MTFAHGLGGGSDLPIPASFAIGGGTAALTLSFVVLLYAWRRPRYTDPAAGQPLPAALDRLVAAPAFAVVLRAVGFAVFAFVVYAALAGQDLLTNPTFGVVYVLLWVGIVPTSLLFGRFFKAVSPARTLHLLLAKVTGSDPDTGVRELPAGLGYWPAAIALFAFVWLELVYPDSTYLGPVRLWFALYFAAMIVGGALFGSKWLERADPFEVYSTLVAHLSVWGRREDGTLVLRSPLRNLATIRPEPGLVAVVAVLLGSTAFDSFRESTTWLRYVQSTTANVTLLNTGLLLLSLLIVGGTFAAATASSGVGVATTRRQLPPAFAHSIVPIIVGYMVAHYLSFFVEVGQQTLIQLSDPLSNGANLFGTSDWEIDYWFSNNPTLLATIKVLAIVTGHVLGVIAAHDRALSVLPARSHVTGQLPLLAAMVLYTFGGLYLLFGA